MLLALFAVFLICLIVFFALVFFLPEWVGITGKKAEEIMDHQQGRESDNTTDPTSKT